MRFVYESGNAIRIYTSPGARQPFSIVSEPVVGDRPQVRVRHELALYVHELGVVGLLLLEQCLALLEALAILLELLELLGDLLDTFRDCLVFLQLGVLMKPTYFPLELIDLALECRLLNHHVGEQGLLILLEVLHDLLERLPCLLRQSKDRPALLVVIGADAVVERLQ